MIASAMLLAPAPAHASACAATPPSNAQPVPAAEVLPTGVEQTRIRWTMWHSRLVYGDAATLEGQVVTDQGAIPEATVRLLTREAGSSEWQAGRSTETDPETGVFSFSCLRPDMSTDYRVVYDGTLYYEGSSADRSTAVARRMADTMRQRAANKFRFIGSVSPEYVDRTVVLQRKNCPKCRWRNVARKDATSRSTWGFTIKTSGFSGSRWYRAMAPADEQYARSYSDRSWRLSTS